MALPSFQPKVRIPLGELIVAEERKSFNQFIPQVSAVSLLEALLKQTSGALLSMKENKNDINTPLIHKNYDHKDLVYSDSVVSGNKVKLVAGKEHGSVLKKPIQKAMILAAQAKIDFVKPAKKIRLLSQKSKEEEEFSYKKELNKVVSIFQNIEKNQETSQVQVENSTKYNISNFSTNAKKPGNKNIVCINSISSTTSNNFKLGGLNITINDEDEDKFSLPFSGKTIKAIV